MPTKKQQPKQTRLPQRTEPDLPDPSAVPMTPDDPQPQPLSPPYHAVSPRPPEVAIDGAPAAIVDKDDEACPMDASLPPIADVAAPEVPPPNPPPPLRKPPNKLRRRLTEKQRAAAAQKLALLQKNVRFVLFSRPFAADLSKHDELFRALGLRDFANLPFDSDVRVDLVASLIAYYDQPNRRSFVNGVRFSVSRADLARSLGLPVKKEKIGEGTSSSSDALQELFGSDESAAAILDFMSSFMLFQFQDDACILPSEVVAATQLVKEGQPQKVDWAGLMWSFVEKELLEVHKCRVSYYCSHLQLLMKYQQPRLFEETEVKMEPVEAETSMDVAMEEEEDADDGTMKTKCLEDLRDICPEKHVAGLSLGLSVVRDEDGFEQCKEGDNVQWSLTEDKNEGIGHCFRRCDSSGFANMEFENLTKVDGEERDDERFDGLSAKMEPLHRLTSTDLLQAMDAVHYSAPENAQDSSSGDFLSMGDDAHKNMIVGPGTGGSFFFGNNGKRQIGEIDDEDEGNAQQQFPQSNQPKRMRSSGAWEPAPSDLYACIEQAQCLMGKAKILSAEKDQAFMSAQLDIQYLNGILHQKDQIIHSLEKASVEEQQKRQQELCRFEHELNIMAQLVVGYKKALKQTRAAFVEYRKKFPQGEEPLYVDVPGGGGLVLSINELEKLRLEEDKQIRCQIAEMIGEFQEVWLSKFHALESGLLVLEKKKAGLDGEYKLVKDRYEQTRSSGTQE